MTEDYSQGWIMLCKNKYPREVGFPARIRVMNDEEVIKYVSGFNGRRNCYFSVYAYEGEEIIPRIDRIFIDFDIEDKEYVPTKDNLEPLKECYEEVKKLYNYLLETFHYEPLVIYTGRRGFHVYIELDEIKLRHPSETIKEFVNRIVNQLNLKFVDMKVIGDVRRLARVPYTIHPKTGLYAYPITLDMTVEEILALAKNPPLKIVKPEISTEITELLLDIDFTVKPKEKKEHEELETLPDDIRPEGGYMQLPCIRGIMENKLKPGNRRKVAGKLIAIAYYKDNGSMDGFEVYAEIFADRQNIGHRLKKSEIAGWIRGASSLNMEWNCGEIIKFLKQNALSRWCWKDRCPYKQALEKHRTLKFQTEIRDYLADNKLLSMAKKLLDYYIVGEDKKKLLLWLLILGGQSIYIKGDTSTGKNNLVEGVLKLFPEDIIYVISASTPKALRWEESRHFNILYIKEVPPQLTKPEITTDFGMDLKLAMSDKKITFRYVTIHEGGLPRTVKREIYFDSVIQTTAALELPEDFENRAWIICTDDSEELTRKVVLWKAKKRTLIEDEVPPEEIKELFKKASSVLRKDIKVVNPMAEELARVLPTKLSRARRDIDKILDLIEIITKTNYTQRIKRHKSGKPILITHPNDVLFALELIHDVFPSMIVGVETRLERAYLKLREAEQQYENVGSAEFASVMGISQAQARNYLKSLVIRGLAKEYTEGRRKFYSAVPYEKFKFNINMERLKEIYNKWLEEHKDEFEET